MSLSSTMTTTSAINGLTFGGGVEWKVTDNVSIRGDYRFTDLDNFSNDGNFHWMFADADFRDRNDVDVNVQRVLFTLNWRFGGFRCHHGGGLLILALDTEVLASGPSGSVCIFCGPPVVRLLNSTCSQRLL